MKLHELAPQQGATHAKKRVGRGIGSGIGKTSVGAIKASRPVAAAIPAPASRAVRCP